MVILRVIWWRGMVRPQRGCPPPSLTSQICSADGGDGGSLERKFGWAAGVGRYEGAREGGFHASCKFC